MSAPSSSHTLCSSSTTLGSGSLQLLTASYPSPVYASQCLCLVTLHPHALTLTLQATLVLPPGLEPLPPILAAPSKSLQSQKTSSLSPGAPTSLVTPSAGSIGHLPVGQSDAKLSPQGASNAQSTGTCGALRMDVQYNSGQTFTVCPTEDSSSNPTTLVTNVSESERTLQLMLHNPNLDLVTAHVNIEVYPESDMQINCTDLGSNIWVSNSHRMSRREFMRGDIIAGSILALMVLLVLVLAFSKQLTTGLNKIRQVKGTARYLRDEEEEELRRTRVYRQSTNSQRRSQNSYQRRSQGSPQRRSQSQGSSQRRSQGTTESRLHRSQDIRRMASGRQPVTSQYQNFGYSSEQNSSFFDQINQHTISSILLDTVSTESLHASTSRQTPQWEHRVNVHATVSSGYQSNGNNTQYRDSGISSSSPNRYIAESTATHSNTQHNPAAGHGCLWRIPINMSPPVPSVSSNNSSSLTSTTKQLLHTTSQQISRKQHHRVPGQHHNGDTYKYSSSTTTVQSDNTVTSPGGKTSSRAATREAIDSMTRDETSGRVMKNNDREMSQNNRAAQTQEERRAVGSNHIHSDIPHTGTEHDNRRRRKSRGQENVDLNVNDAANVHVVSIHQVPHESHVPTSNTSNNNNVETFSATEGRGQCSESTGPCKESKHLETTTTSQSHPANSKTKRTRKKSGPLLKEESNSTNQSDLCQQIQTSDQLTFPNDKSRAISQSKIKNGISIPADQSKRSTEEFTRIDHELLLVNYRSSPQPRRSISPLVTLSDNNKPSRTDRRRVVELSAEIHNNRSYESEV